MAETSFAEQVIPGTFVRVRAEGLIGTGSVSTGNIGIVGTAAQGVDETVSLSDYEAAQAQFGAYDAYAAGAGTLNLTRALEILFRNGARTVYARAVAAGANKAAFAAAFDELVKEDINLVVAPELSTADAKDVLVSLAENAENGGKDLLAVVGADATAVTDIVAQVTADDRLIMTAPGIAAFDVAANGGAGLDVTLNGRYSAAAVAGLLSTLGPEASPTNKVLAGVPALERKFGYSEAKDLIKGGITVLEDRAGIRVVRGISTEMRTNGPFRQITTRRITDYAKSGIRQAANAFIGRLNNERVRKALRGSIDGFLTTMVVDEMLIAYTLDVTATRQDEIAGAAIVNVVLQPTFSIDFIRVTLVLE